MTADDRLAAGPVFIVGMNGFGTTMMLDHLGQRPDLFGRIQMHILRHDLASAQDGVIVELGACVDAFLGVIWSKPRSPLLICGVRWCD
jgi:hypothetical protein